MLNYKAITYNFIKYYSLGLSILGFCITGYFAFQIKFMQNDDWVYYGSVARFLDGNFTLHPDTGTLFYPQGILAYFFSLFFGVSQLPVLTFIISILGFVVLYLIFRKYFAHPKLISLLSALLIFLNPLYYYSILGFMSENYGILFFVLALYFLLNFIKSSKQKDYMLFVFFTLVASFIRQTYLFVFVSAFIYFVYKRDYKKAFLQMLYVIGFIMFYLLLFPKTAEMQEKTGTTFQNALDLKYIYALLIGSIIYLSAFLLPVKIDFFLSEFKKHNFIKYIFGFLIAGVAIYIGIEVIKERFEIDFPYFINTFTQKGFFTNGLPGVKYHFAGYYDLFRIWKYAAIITSIGFLSIFLVKLSFKFKNLSDTFILLFSLLIGYFGILVITPNMFDRYLIPLFILSLLLISEFQTVKSKLFIYIMPCFLTFLGLLNYQYAFDFVNWQNFSWRKANELSKITSPENICASRAWGIHNNGGKFCEYIITFDTYDEGKWMLYDRKRLSYPFMIFIDPSVQIYKRQMQN